MLDDWLEINPEDQVDVEVIEHPAPLTERSVARRVALQVLYEVDCTDHLPGNVIDARLHAQELEKKGANYVRLLVKGVLDHSERIDLAIQKYAAEWPLDQIAIIDRNILRMAIFEFAISQTTSAGTAIAEAVGLASLFGADSSLAFVNGVLGQLAANEDDLHQILEVSS